MMQLKTSAIVCTLLGHGEHGVIGRFLTAEDGLVAGYIRGGRGRRLRPVLQPGNIVALTLAARLDNQLASATVELGEARAALITGSFGLATLEWATILTAAALTEGAPHPALHAGLDALVAMLAAEAPPVQTAAALARYELLLLAETGFGLDLASCAATGTTQDLAFVSPRSSQAVSRTAGLPWAARLLPLPAFLITDHRPDASDVHAALVLPRHFLARDILAGSAARLFAARDRLTARLPVDESGTSG
ncbi:DNA repair protein RecO [Polymorphobacter multimanifer]|uniref:DNA repair protein RecO n=1 Tax=Polymorphobacter multimanifer TaxID=1070431 RepID=UPI00166ADFC5|nr:DNA repair protein RecO [Polymorphobacter multimanifer]